MEIPSSGDQYNLKWNNHLANFVQTFIEHQHGESLVDVTLSCEGQYIKTHKLILSACSDYFHSIFQVHGSLQHPIILLNGVRFSDLKYILHFMYHGEVKVVDKDLPNVLALGETLQIKGLSSVKLRDMPPEEVPPLAHRMPKRNRKAHNSKDQLLSTPLPQRTSRFVPIAPFDYSKDNSPQSTTPNQVTLTPNIVNQPESLSLSSSVTFEAPSTRTIVVPESPPINGSSKNKSPGPNTSSPSKEVTNPVPKPPHAFMIFAKEWRKKLTIEHPEENNKEISVRLGSMWKDLLDETKSIYYREAKRAEEEHRLKYPNYTNPNESLKRKSDTLNYSTNGSPSTPLDPMEIVEIQEQISLSDSE